MESLGHVAVTLLPQQGLSARFIPVASLLGLMDFSTYLTTRYLADLMVIFCVFTLRQEILKMFLLAMQTRPRREDRAPVTSTGPGGSFWS